MSDSKESRQRAIAVKRAIRVYVDGALTTAKDEVTDAITTASNVRWNTVAGREATRVLAQAEGRASALQAVREFLSGLNA